MNAPCLGSPGQSMVHLDLNDPVVATAQFVNSSAPPAVEHWTLRTLAYDHGPGLTPEEVVQPQLLPAALWESTQAVTVPAGQTIELVVKWPGVDQAGHSVPAGTYYVVITGQVEPEGTPASASTCAVSVP